MSNLMKYIKVSSPFPITSIFIYFELIYYDRNGRRSKTSELIILTFILDFNNGTFKAYVETWYPVDRNAKIHILLLLTYFFYQQKKNTQQQQKTTQKNIQHEKRNLWVSFYNVLTATYTSIPLSSNILGMAAYNPLVFRMLTLFILDDHTASLSLGTDASCVQGQIMSGNKMQR